MKSNLSIKVPEGINLQALNRLDMGTPILVYPYSGIAYINNPTFIRIMGISKQTAQIYRSRGIIPYSRFRGRVYYKIDDVNLLLDSYSNSPIYSIRN